MKGNSEVKTMAMTTRESATTTKPEKETIANLVCKARAAMDAFAKQRGLMRNGYHHEIYLSDPNRTAPEKMRTILRQPVKPE